MRFVEAMVGIGAVIALGACGNRGASIEAEAHPSARPSAAPTDAPTSSANTTPTEVPPVSPRITSATLPLSIFDGDPNGHAWDNDRRRIFAVGGKMVVTPAFAVLTDGKLLPSGEGITPDDFPGEDNTGQVVGANWITPKRVMGRFPSDVWVYGSGSYGLISPRTTYSTDRTYMHQRQYGKWGRVKEWPAAAEPWTKGRTLALLETGGFKLAQPAKGALAELPKQAAGKSCPTRVSGSALAILPAGDVLVLGTDCDAEGRLAVERWDGDAVEALAKSRVIALPSPPEAKVMKAWLFAGPKATYALADLKDRPYFAAIQGEAARAIGLPVKKLEDAHMAADGTLFLYGDGDLYRFDGESDGAAQFTRASLPKGLQAKEMDGLFAASKDVAYLAILTDHRASLLLTTDPSAPAPTVSADAPAASGSAVTAADVLASFPTLDAACKTPFVVLFPVTRSTPKDFAFPQTKTIVKSFPGRENLEVVDFDRNGDRFVGVIAPDAKTAESFAQHWNQRDEKTKCRTACFGPPEGARTVAMD